ncbi:MAG: redoxin domain-containing protein [Oscillospiraceae bacterium]|jgi:peroxiredoxin|nr:redoxin domain-containing protein [Oscillospiraceae bacterium]
MIFAKKRRALYCLLATLILVSILATNTADAIAEERPGLFDAVETYEPMPENPDIMSVPVDMAEVYPESIPENPNTASAFDPLPAAESYDEPSLILLPENTGYAVGAFDQQPRQSGGTTRADVLPFMLNDVAPDFSLQSTNGDFKTLSGYRGINVILTFWTSWKEDCLSSLSSLRSAQRRFPDISILAVNSLPAENNNAAWTEEAFIGHINWINSYFDENGFGFSALLDINGQVSSAFMTEQLPMTYFIDKDGIIRITWPGALTGDTLNTLLDMMAALDR